jgi:hypothetical protein
MALVSPEATRELPLRVSHDGEQYFRLQYTFQPASVSQGTVSRSVRFDPSRPGFAYVDHTLNTGDKARFRGLWKESPEAARQCILVFAKDEVVCVPLSGSIVQLTKERA